MCYISLGKQMHNPHASEREREREESEKKSKQSPKRYFENSWGKEKNPRKVVHGKEPITKALK